MRSFKMGEQPKTVEKSNMHAIVLAILGILLLIVGVYIATVHGAPLRGSGVGTISIIIGVVLFAISLLRFFYKKP
jgi:hypothetical protein